MRTTAIRWVPLLVLLAGAGPQAAPQNPSELVVHEWGTFLSMSGSDGATLDGMYHEEHALPAFVHARGRDQLRPRSIFLKGETPVIYFYTPKEQNVYVEVKFPRGMWTQWYPQAQFVLPRLATLPVPAASGVRDGRIAWSARVIPASGKGVAPQLPATSADALWNFAREVDAAYVTTVDPAKGGAVEAERFLFYRGLGTSNLLLRMTAEAGGTLAADASGPGVSHVFVVRVEGGRGVFTYRRGLAPGETVRGVIPTMAGARPIGAFADAIAGELAGRLADSGLYPKEARAMVNTWRSSYFGTDGVRALFVLPQPWTDAFIPMSIRPVPKATTRVMVGRIELLTPERERLAEAAVRDLASPDAARRATAFETLRKQGRYVEPIIRRVLAATRDESVRVLCRRLLLTDFVTDLRSALRSAAATGPLPPDFVLNEEPAHVRARLAALLREVGLDEQAKAEGATALASLKQKLSVGKEVCEARHDLRATALATEGTGDDAGAARGYARLVDLAAVALRRNDCRKCHRDVAADVTERPRDWWGGAAYARAVVRGGGLAGAIAEETTLRAIEGDSPRRDAASLRLGYLYRAAGREADSEAIWSALGLRAAAVALGDAKK